MAERNKGKRLVVMAAIGILAAAAVPAQTNVASGAEDVLRRAYVAVVEAELAGTEQRTADAISAYRTAAGLFGRLQAEYPGWREDMVAYRVADCQSMIAQLEAGAATNKFAVDAPAGGVSSNAETRLQLLTQELKLARAWLAQGGASETRKMLLLEQEIRQLRAERDQAVRQAQVAGRQAARLETRLKRSGQGDAGARTNAPVLLTGAIRAEATRLMKDGQFDKAFNLLRECAEAFPDQAEFDILAAVSACRAGRFDIAVGILKPYETRKPANTDALLTLGTAWMGLGRIGEARVATEKVLALNPGSAEANYNMAQIFLTLRPADPVAAEKHYQSARELGLEADPDFENNLRMAFIISRLKKRTAK